MHETCHDFEAWTGCPELTSRARGLAQIGGLCGHRGMDVRLPLPV